MADWRIGLGTILGLAIFALLRTQCGSAVGPEHGPLLSDSDGRLSELVIHHTIEAAPFTERAYGQFLTALGPEVKVHVVCPDEAAFKDLLDRLGPVDCKLEPITTRHPISTWSRDRWLAFQPQFEGGPSLILSPREETAAGIWPARAGDQRAGDALESALFPQLIAARSHLAFDGGDFVADLETVFVTPAVLDRNLGRTVDSREDLVAELEGLFERRVVLLEQAPQHHAGMFLMLTGQRTALVGDPSLAKHLATSTGEPLVEHPDFGPETQARFDAVAASCSQAGYRVIRMPVVPDKDGRSYLTPLNVILERRAGQRIVYLPVYRGATGLNRLARSIWEGLNYQVVPVDCTDTFRMAGSLRCLVNVLRRGV